MKIEQFIRKLNSTELNLRSTNDAYIRISKDIQDEIPDVFFEELDSKHIDVVNKSNSELIDNWLRYQHYPSNNEYRIVSLSSIYKHYNASPGDYVYIEKVSTKEKVHYEIYMKCYEKVSLKYSKSKSLFEILNEDNVKQMNILNKDLNLHFKDEVIKTNISFNQSIKKRLDSPTESNFYSINNLPDSIYNNIKGDSFIEVFTINNKYYMSILKSWDFNKFTL